MDDKGCQELMERFIEEKPEVWYDKELRNGL